MATELLITRAATANEETVSVDANTRRILDAALYEAAAVGVQLFTIEDVVRRSGLGRMTVYRRFALSSGLPTDVPAPRPPPSDWKDKSTRSGDYLPR